VAYSDASVHPLSYDINPVIFSRLGGRDDGEIAHAGD
jgi:hypothetical protein